MLQLALENRLWVAKNGHTHTHTHTLISSLSVPLPLSIMWSHLGKFMKILEEKTSMVGLSSVKIS